LEKENAVCPICRHQLKNKSIQNPSYNAEPTHHTEPTHHAERTHHAEPTLPTDQHYFDILNNPFAELFQQMQINKNITTQLLNDNTYGSRLMQQIFSMINTEDDLHQAILQN
jgi:hypothetical protein